MKKGIKAEELSARQIISLKMLREPRQVRADADGYAECPNCHGFVDVDYVRYCSRCGQRLAWNVWYKEVMQQEWQECRERWAYAKSEEEVD